jgi:hypothetical protein
MKWKPSFRVALRRVVVCLIIGAVVNVLVAWGIAILVTKPLIQSLTIRSKPAPATWPAGTPSPWDSSCYEWARFKATGRSLVMVSSYRDIGGFTKKAITLGFGFPLKSVEYSVFMDLQGTTRHSTWGALDVHPIDRWLGLPMRYSSHLPVFPIPAGFAMNTLVYASGVFTVFLGFSALQRRMMRGGEWCVRCGYDVRGVKRCPECGEVVVHRGLGEASLRIRWVVRRGRNRCAITTTAPPNK